MWHAMRCVLLCYCVHLYNMNRKISQVKVTLVRDRQWEGAESAAEREKTKGKSMFTTQQERPTYFQLSFNWLLKKVKKKCKLSPQGKTVLHMAISKWYSPPFPTSSCIKAKAAPPLLQLFTHHLRAELKMEHLTLKAIFWMAAVLLGCLGAPTPPAQLDILNSNIGLMRRTVDCVSFFPFCETNILCLCPC